MLFQLTVNISILTLSALCSVIGIICPLSVLHLLWLDLIMDSAASIALASEPPTEELLKRPPVNRNDSIVTKHMLLNMVGVAAYEVGLMMWLLYGYEWVPNLKVDPSDPSEPIIGPTSRRDTILCNIFVFLQVLNEYNARFSNCEWQL